jgi:phosphoribosyl 1,2-cyclic phosphodiesterase
VSITEEVDGKIHRLIIDSGTGIIKLGKEIISNFFAKKEDLNINLLFTHLHPDHTQGFPFFGPNYFKGCEIDLYGMSALGSDIEQILSSQMTPPNFPIEYRSLKSNRKHITVNDGDEYVFPAFSVQIMQAYAPSHPQQGALYYRIYDKNGKSVACIWDNESKVGGDKAVIKFIAGADVVIHDTQFTTEEYESSSMIVQGFGHSTYAMALDNVTQAKAKKLVCIHYNPAHTDDKLTELQAHYLPYGMSKEFGDIPVLLSKEGMEIEV